jgi:ParB family chromosome partitioning protein
LSVRRIDSAMGGRDRYQIIAGERRWRAAQLAQLPKVPVVIKDVPASEKKRLLEMALIENIQREDLNPMEAAAAYQRLVDVISPEAGRHLGAGRQGVARPSRTICALLKLPEEVRGNVASAHCRWATRARSSRSRRKPTSAASPATSCRAASRCARPKRS